MLKWCAKNNEIHDYMVKIKKHPPEAKASTKSLHPIIGDSHVAGTGRVIENLPPLPEVKSLGTIINSKKYQ